MKKLLLFSCIIVSSFAFSQSINDYKYVLVPSQFKFQSEPNQYRLNFITKGLLQKYGFEAFLDTDPIPNDVLNYNCNKLYADVLENNNITSTKLTVVLKDCKNNILFSSDEGKSKEKDWRIGYNMALRDAFNSFDNLHYNYNGSVVSIEREVIKTTNDGTTVKKEIAIGSKPQMIVDATKMLYAQPSANGYQLIDSTPKVIVRLFNTSSKDLFIAEKDQSKGALYNHNGAWILEYYENGKLISETLNIKF
jgi:hypothetical protein